MQAVFSEGVKLDVLQTVFGEGFELDVLRAVFGEGVELDVLRAALEAGLEAEIFLPHKFGEVVEGLQPAETAEVPGFPLGALLGFLTDADGATF